jgi:hypothetical protein
MMKASPAKSIKTDASKKRSRDEAGDATQSSSSPPPSPHPNPAKEWKKAKLKSEDLLTMVNNGFLSREGNGSVAHRHWKSVPDGEKPG